MEWSLLQAYAYTVGALVQHLIWCEQRKSLCTLDLIAATLQALWAVTLCCTSITPIRPDGGADSRGERESISCAVRRGWQRGQVENQLDLPWTAQISAEGDLTEPVSRLHLHSSPGSYIAFSLLSSAYQYIISPQFFRLKCKNCLHVPCRAEADSWKTPMWETGNSSYHNTQHSFVRSTATCDVLIFLSAGCWLT